jgi:hypothetical protein
LVPILQLGVVHEAVMLAEPALGVLTATLALLSVAQLVPVTATVNCDEQ